ncbi:MAG: alpha/beta hydrolase [Cyanobacteria bacterium]|nr:alpha/beta hydrolase [Cyanobacteriota bacterium]
MAIRFGIQRRLRFWVAALGAGCLQSLLLALPGASAERVYVNYGLLERYVTVESLETYARTGELPEELEVYSRYFTPEQLEQLRLSLLTRADLDVVAVSQFLYTPQGEAILDWLGEIVQTAARLNGSRAIRGAVILAAADPDGGLNLINVLKWFPTQGIRLDLQRLSGVADAVVTELNETTETTRRIQAQAAAAVAESGRDRSLASQFQLGSAGSYGWERRVLNQVALPTHLYVPEGRNAPLVVISHGLGGDRSTLAYLAEHLASHGFAVAVVEHPGSSANQLNALLAGRSEEAVESADLIRRPIGIQALLDDLEAMAQNDPALGQRIDFKHIGVLGQSLGGYTSLALAGATVDQAALAEACPPQIDQLNLSLLLQCSVLSAPQPLPTLQDQRVQAVIAINPLSSQIFGPAGLAHITVPVMVVSGTADTVTPALAEQIRPFTWLSSAERYLMLLEGGTHFSTIYNPRAGAEVIPLPEAVVGPNPALAQQYVKVIGLAFFKTYLAEDESYRQYLDPAYANALSQSGLPLALVRELILGD